MFAELAALALATAQPAGGVPLEAACAGRDGWSDPAPPVRIIANIYYVGTCGITVLLITSPQGHILIDGATEEAAPFILRNIRTLGFDPRHVRYILSSHEHLDHVGGLAALRRATGAQVVARAPARRSLQTGRADPADPQARSLQPFTGVHVDRIVADGEVVRVGPLRLTAIATPGHTMGGTSWTWNACAARTCTRIVYADSLSAVSADGYRFSDQPVLVETFRRTFARVAALDCDLLITPHPGASNLFRRMAMGALLVDRTGCRAYADSARQRLGERLEREAAR